MKKTLLSIALGLVLAAAPIAIFAGCCPGSIVVNGKRCVLTGSNCGGSVSVCSYACGPNPN